jgi:hypothetical protein
VRPVWSTGTFFTNDLMRETVEKWLNYLATALADISAVSMPIARALNLTAVALQQMHISERPHCPQHKVNTCHQPHLSSGWITLEKSKCSNLCTMRELCFCVWDISGIFFSAHETIHMVICVHYCLRFPEYWLAKSSELKLLVLYRRRK